MVHTCELSARNLFSVSSFALHVKEYSTTRVLKYISFVENIDHFKNISVFLQRVRRMESWPQNRAHHDQRKRRASRYEWFRRTWFGCIWHGGEHQCHTTSQRPKSNTVHSPSLSSNPNDRNTEEPKKRNFRIFFESHIFWYTGVKMRQFHYLKNRHTVQHCYLSPSSLFAIVKIILNIFLWRGMTTFRFETVFLRLSDGYVFRFYSLKLNPYTELV